MRNAVRRLVLVAAASCCPFHAFAAPQDPMTQSEQLQEAREESRMRQERMRQERIEVEGLPEVSPPESVPGGMSFRITEIRIEGLTPQFSFLRKTADAYAHTDMDLHAVNALVHEMNMRLMERGYATSRVVLPEQNIGEGTLRLQLSVGRVGHILYAAESARTPYENAFPVREGDALNVHLLEQGIEQMQRLSSQTVKLRLLPSDIPGASDIELAIDRKDSLHGVLSADDSGLKNTGRIQYGLGLSFDNLLNYNDILRIDLNGDGAREGYRKGTRGQSVYYSMPAGKDTFSFFYSRYRYHQTVNSRPYPFISEGKSDSGYLRWDHLIMRDQRQKISWDVSIRRRLSHQYINDLEIPIQKMNTTALDFGLSGLAYGKDSLLYARLGHRMGLGWFGAQPDSAGAGAPTTRYHMWLLDVQYQKALSLGRRPLTYTASLHGQWTTGGDRLYGVDMISMGNRYTVRGFDGENTLMGESGWYLRNELSSRIEGIKSDVYVGLDIGRVYGPNTEDLLGKCIAGAVLGLRGSLPSGLSYDVFLGTPLYKPQGYRTSHMTAGFQIEWRF